MNVRDRVRYIIIASLVTLAIGGVGAVWSVRRVNSFRELQIETQGTLADAYRLLVDTSLVTTTAERLGPYFERWQQSLESTEEGIDFVVDHPLLRNVDFEQNLSSVRLGWENASDIFDEATDQMEQILDGELIGVMRPSGIDNMAFQLRTINNSPNRRVREEELTFVRNLERRMHNGTVSLNYFVTENLQTLARRIDAEANQAIQNTTYLTAGAIGLLVLLAAAGLLTGTSYLNAANLMLKRNVEKRTQSIRSLLDFSGQGFLSFGSDFKVREEYSRECVSIFKQELTGKDIADLLYKSQWQQDEFKDSMQLVFSGSSHPEVVFDLIDDTVKIAGKIVRLDFRQIDEDTIMCSLIDVTEQKELEARLNEQEDLRRRLLTIVEHRSDFGNLILEAQDVFTRLGDVVANDDVEAENPRLDSAVRALHTFKANAAFLKLDRTARAAHSLEQNINDSLLLSDTPSITEGVSALQQAYHEDLSVVEQHLGSEWVSPDRTIVVSAETLDALEDAIRSSGAAVPAVIDRVRDLRRIPISAIESRVSAMVAQLADQRGKRLRPLDSELGQVAVDPQAHLILTDALTHLIRNMVDHGIERPRDREAAGKAPEGVIRLSAREDDDMVTVTVEDDGRGIDLEAIRKKAVERNLLDENADPGRAELLKMIFRDGFSTAASVSAVSGRGEGLPAVREALNTINGKLSIATRQGKGTRFVITIPKHHETEMAV